MSTHPVCKHCGWAETPHETRTARRSGDRPLIPIHHHKFSLENCPGYTEKEPDRIPWLAEVSRTVRSQ